MTGFAEIRGGRNLSRIARDLKQAGNGDLRKELLAGIRKPVKAAIPDVRTAAATDLPKRGGLAARVAKQKYAARTSLSRSEARVRLVGSGMKELDTIDQGRVRHPVWGDRQVWKSQRVTPGFFSGTLSRKGPAIRQEIDRVMHAVARKIERGV